jgi:hypothetical protein
MSIAGLPQNVTDGKAGNATTARYSSCNILAMQLSI